ncbi:helix-turn-helix transcriptional regulator [uncultured Psychrosphaera sp.]|uniref:helix-turn-helix transcriptional regulator n=1 Tax=uncultured Psychrosphaera sp. TaxID=1403522 RepID=UPI0030F827FF
MIHVNVFYKKEVTNSTAVTSQLPTAFNHKIVSYLYQIDVHQALLKVQQQVLEVIAAELNFDAILWHAAPKKQLIDEQSLLKDFNLGNKNISSFDVSLDDSNVHHYWFVSFPNSYLEADIQSHSEYFSTLLQLTAEIYRQTLIHSYYREWQHLPFEKQRQLMSPPDSEIQESKEPNTNQVTFYERWQETIEADRAVLVREKRIENQLFVDKFIMPNAIHKLTLKQKQICFFLKACCSNQQIAENLNISIKTVGNHLTAIYEKLEISRAELFQLLNTTR